MKLIVRVHATQTFTFEMEAESPEQAFDRMLVHPEDYTCCDSSDHDIDEIEVYNEDDNELLYQKEV